MARLNNDAGIASETLESLKRRFVRQNREIARANSIQSLRIRTLESEVSRLLSENCTLREEITLLNAGLEKYQSNKLIDDEILRLRTALDSKVKEFSSLITELGSLPKRRGALVRENQQSDEYGQVAAEIYRQKKSSREAFFEDEMRLPAILEDGNAQQWVPNPEDLVEIEDNDIHDTTEEAEEEVPSKNSTNAEASNSQVPEDGHASLPTNTLPPISESSLEHTSTPVIPPESEAVAPAEPVEAVQQDTTQSPVSQPSQAKRRSLKRKLSICEEDTTSSGKENDVFRFTRVSDGERPQKTAHVDVTSDTRASKQGRRALEPKNSNTKLPSPVKVAKEGKEPAKIPEKKEKAQKGKRKGRRSTKTVTPSFVENQTHVAEIKLDERQPTTDTSSAIAPTENAVASPHAVPEVGAPLTPERSRNSLPPPPCHTPPPQSSTSSEALGISARPSRRSRPAVSYAEPNLRAKMRRPTKEFVGAVEGERTSRRTSRSDGGVDGKHAASNVITQDALNAYMPQSSKEHSIPNASLEAPSKEDSNGLVVPLPSNVMTSRKRTTLSASKDDLSESKEATEASPTPTNAGPDASQKAENTHADAVPQADTERMDAVQPSSAQEKKSTTRRQSANPTKRGGGRRRTRNSSIVADEVKVPDAKELDAALEETFAPEVDTELPASILPQSKPETEQRQTRRRSMMV